MLDQKQTISELKFYKKIAFILCLAVSLMLFTTNVTAASNELETVYHVYLDGKHVGKVDNDSLVKEYINKTINSGKEKYPKYTIKTNKSVTIIPEKVFNPTYNNENVIAALKEELSIVAEAVELEIAGKMVGYFSDEETVQQILNSYKAKFVGQDILNKLELKDKPNGSGPQSVTELDSTGDDTTILEVKLSAAVKTKAERVIPQDILTAEQGVNMLEKGTLEDRKHKVVKGEVLESISSNYELSTDDILKLNPSLTKESILHIGDELNVTEYAPFVSVIVKKEDVRKETIKHETEIIESDELYKGETKVKQEGADGKKSVRYAFEFTNGTQTKKKVIEETITLEPRKKIVIKGTKVISSRGTGNLHWPTIGGYVSSNVGMRWGRMHKGIDIARPSNRAILAADNGVVVAAGRKGGFGNRVIINHNNGMKTIYAHLSSIGVRVGQVVEGGSKIGVMGATGNVTGVHLHFEIHVNGALKRPSRYY
ncbi:peptidoglycan DD-metalloendopeptidase family protein [Virgibacillus sp. DJP39]|uniref:peptidoglycan DD-metalloendopeptidase family protein n=1 Tax=Virgibacillus sp. DJP39 TaxID=3409790 RepID=UPI003BB50599